MPIVFPALIGLLAMLAALGALILLRTEAMWLRPLLLSLTHPSGLLGKILRASGVLAILNGVLYVEKQVRLALSHFAAGSLILLTRWFNGMATALHWTYKEYGDFAQSWADNFAIFRNRTLPHAIKKGVLPVAAAAGAAGALAGQSISLGKATRIRTGRSIDRLRKQLGLLAGILLGIDILVKGRHARVHHGDHTKTLPAHTKAIDDLRSRIKAVEKALGLGILTGLVFKVLARVAPWLFCRNVKRLGNVACGLNPNTMSALEALLLGTLAIENLEALARFTAAIEEELAHEVKDLLSA